MLALAAIQLHRPQLGQDAITYHLADVVGWIQSGHTGRVQTEFYGLPVGNYPVTQEVLLAWATGISHGFSAALIITVAALPLLLGAGWLGLGELGIPRPLRVLALAALALVPLIVQAWVQPGTDLSAMTWLALCGALCLAARRHPGLLAAAVVAAGLAVGTKTTVLSYAVVMLAVTAWFRRAELRSRRRPLAAAAALAVVTGLVWYLRNWIEHGSPLWPFSSFPGGDPRPATINFLSTSLLDSLRPTLLDNLHGYVSGISGGVILILIGILAVLPGLVLRRRRLLLAGLVVLAGTLEYSVGPVTGLPPREDVLVAAVGSTLRYLMPVFAAGAVALALAASDSNRLLAGAGLLALAGATVWGLVSDIPDGFFLPFDYWLWPGIAIAPRSSSASPGGRAGSPPRRRGAGSASGWPRSLPPPWPSSPPWRSRPVPATSPSATPSPRTTPRASASSCSPSPATSTATWGSPPPAPGWPSWPVIASSTRCRSSPSTPAAPAWTAWPSTTGSSSASPSRRPSSGSSPPGSRRRAPRRAAWRGSAPPRSTRTAPSPSTGP